MSRITSYVSLLYVARKGDGIWGGRRIEHSRTICSLWEAVSLNIISRRLPAAEMCFARGVALRVPSTLLRQVFFFPSVQVTDGGLERVAPHTQFLRRFLLTELTQIYKSLHSVPALDILTVNGPTSFLNVMDISVVARLYHIHDIAWSRSACLSFSRQLLPTMPYLSRYLLQSFRHGIMSHVWTQYVMCGKARRRLVAVVERHAFTFISMQGQGASHRVEVSVTFCI